MRKTLTPQLERGDAALVLIDLGAGKNRLGGSCLAQVYGQVGDEAPDAPAPDKLKSFFDVIQQLNLEGKLLSYHDRSDGGLFVTLLEMAFAGNVGLDITLAAADLAELFSEELGAVVQVATSGLDDVIARPECGGSHNAGCWAKYSGKRNYHSQRRGDCLSEHPHGSAEDVGGDQLSRPVPSR